jgi:serine/threonine protein kinase
MQDLSHLSLDWQKLITQMLQFNPYFRHSSRELLKSPLFDDIRIIENEKQQVEKLKLVIDADESFDYEACKSEVFTKPDYIRMIYQEVLQVHAIREFYSKQVEGKMISKQ